MRNRTSGGVGGRGPRGPLLPDSGFSKKFSAHGFLTEQFTERDQPQSNAGYPAERGQILLLLLLAYLYHTRLRRDHSKRRLNRSQSTAVRRSGRELQFRLIFA